MSDVGLMESWLIRLFCSVHRRVKLILSINTNTTERSVMVHSVTSCDVIWQALLWQVNIVCVCVRCYSWSYSHCLSVSQNAGRFSSSDTGWHNIMHYVTKYEHSIFDYKRIRYIAFTGIEIRFCPILVLQSASYSAHTWVSFADLYVIITKVWSLFCR